MSGFFPCMMFGIPGAALAMIKSAKSNKKKVAIGLLSIRSTYVHFICGVTEPFEFGFMFLAPGLYCSICITYMVSLQSLLHYVGFRAGFIILSWSNRPCCSQHHFRQLQKTWLIIPLGIAAFIVFYVVFRFAMIVKFDLKTPGREDDDDTDETKVDSGKQ